MSITYSSKLKCAALLNKQTFIITDKEKRGFVAKLRSKLDV